MNDIGKINQRDRTQMEIPWQMFSLPCCGMPTRIESLLHRQSRSCGVRVIWNERFPGWADWVEWNSSHKQHLRKLTCAATWFLAQESCLPSMVMGHPVRHICKSTSKPARIVDWGDMRSPKKAQPYHLTILIYFGLWMYMVSTRSLSQHWSNAIQPFPENSRMASPSMHSSVESAGAAGSCAHQTITPVTG